MSALDDVINTCRDKIYQPTEEHANAARAELAQLRADLQAAYQRNAIMEQANREMSAEVVSLHKHIAALVAAIDRACEQIENGNIETARNVLHNAYIAPAPEQDVTP